MPLCWVVGQMHQRLPMQATIFRRKNAIEGAHHIAMKIIGKEHVEERLGLLVHRQVLLFGKKLRRAVQMVLVTRVEIDCQLRGH
ncbi:hypothetical protein D9M69_569780 [compost metagenome]